MDDGMAPRIIVNYSQIVRGVGADEAVSSAREGIGDDVEAATAEAVLSNALVALQDAETHPDVLSSPDDARGSLLQAFLAEQAEREDRVQPIASGAALEAKMDDKDWIRWAGSVGWAWIKGKLSGDKARFLPPPEPSDWATIPDDTRIAILGDWGTGLYGAPRCAMSIKGDSDGFGAVVHLGDVYYAGTNKEVRQHFLNHWPRVPGAVYRACNSNHEMYTGGEPYFTDTLADFGQNSSVFVLQNRSWVIVGLDTAYDEHKLAGDQLAFLRGVVNALEGRKLVLLSHHQPFSLLAKKKSGLQVLPDDEVLRNVFAWYWGHEHLCALYEPSDPWGLLGRCVGHSGYPYFRPREVMPEMGERDPDAQVLVPLPGKGDVPGAVILDGPNPYVEGHQYDYGPHGYVALHLDGAHLHETLYDCDGNSLWDNDPI